MRMLRPTALAATFLFVSACSNYSPSVPTQTTPTAQTQHATIDAQAVPVSAKFGERALPAADVQPLRKRRATRDTSAGPHLWLGDYRGAIWETNAAQTVEGTGTTIVGALYDCGAPYGLKFDTAGNLWAACSATGTVNMYAPKATTATLVLHATRTEGSSQVTALTDDVVRDAAGNVYVANAVTKSGSFFSATYTVGEIDVFLAKCGGLPCNGATPDIVLTDPDVNHPCPKKGSCELNYGLSFIDIDANGTLYQDFFDKVYACTQKCKLVHVSVGLEKISNPLKKAKYTSLVRRMVSPAGISITAAGSVLNMLDAGTGMISQYTLFPFKKQGALGPTPQSPHFRNCIPVGIGFNLSLKLVAAGDAGCNAAIVGDTATNQFTGHRNISYGQLTGAAFEPYIAGP
jgi:hypothetical protein